MNALYWMRDKLDDLREAVADIIPDLRASLACRLLGLGKLSSWRWGLDGRMEELNGERGRMKQR